MQCSWKASRKGTTIIRKKLWGSGTFQVLHMLTNDSNHDAVVQAQITHISHWSRSLISRLGHRGYARACQWISSKQAWSSCGRCGRGGESVCLPWRATLRAEPCALNPGRVLVAYLFNTLPALFALTWSPGCDGHIKCSIAARTVANEKRYQKPI